MSVSSGSDKLVRRTVKKKREDEVAASEKRTTVSMKPSSALSRTQKQVATWLKKNVPVKKTRFLHSHEVWFFIGCRAVDALLKNSPWAQPNDDLHFQTREQCVQYLDELLKHKMFHRAKKIPVASDPMKPGKKKSKSSAVPPAEDVTAVNKESDEAEDEDRNRAEAGKKKRKIRLDMHLEQMFLDTQDAYVWLYDPIPTHYWLIGGVIVVAVIAVCLFPLWPPKLRIGVHYLSLAAAGFLGLVVALAILKYLLFALFWALSAGKLRFWLMPNLTEDVGFLESFWPLYDYSYSGTPVQAQHPDADESDQSECEE